MEISKSYRFNFFYLQYQYFALHIALIFIMICDKYFTIGKIDTTIIFFDLETIIGYLLDLESILVARIDLGLKILFHRNTWILAQ